MPYRQTPLVNDSFYHIYNRGVEKREIYTVDGDYKRFLETLYYYQFSGPKPQFSNRDRFKSNEFDKNPKIVELVCFCLMPNHFHLMLKQLKDKGIQEFMGKLANSYTKYFNTKHNRVGPLLQGEFKAVLVESDEQLVHLSRYIFLNPYVAEITKDWENFPYSSFREFINKSVFSICCGEHILTYFKDLKCYREFISDQMSYALEVARIQHLLIDED